MTTKKFLLIILAIYVVGAGIGRMLFKGPDYSEEYLRRFGADHERYRAILDNKEFHKYEQRPKLYPNPSETLIADLHFVEEYRSRPEFRAERRRMFLYDWYFKILNVVVFVALLVRFTKQPILAALDARVEEIRNALRAAREDAVQAAQLESAAARKINEWDQTAQQIRMETDQRIRENLARIAQEFEYAKEQLRKETADRKQAEVYRASKMIRQEIVAEMVRRIERRHRDDATVDRLSANVDQFIRIMERLS